MKCQKIFLCLFVLLSFVSLPLFSESYYLASEIDPLLEELQTEYENQKQLSLKWETQYQECSNKLNLLEIQSQNLNSQVQNLEKQKLSLESQLTNLEKSYQKSNRRNTVLNITIGIASFSAGAGIGVIVYKVADVIKESK